MKRHGTCTRIVQRVLRVLLIVPVGTLVDVVLPHDKPSAGNTSRYVMFSRPLSSYRSPSPPSFIGLVYVYILAPEPKSKGTLPRAQYILNVTVENTIERRTIRYSQTQSPGRSWDSSISKRRGCVSNG